MIINDLKMYVNCMFIYLSISIVEIKAYNMKCPHRSQWSTRAKEYNKQCFPGKSYHCLYDKNLNKTVEECFKHDDLPPGNKGVKRGGLDAEVCSEDHFAPNWSWSNESVECMYQKNECFEEGQRVYRNKSATNDTTCQCDISNGYRFLVEPKDKVSCLPWIEDCTCYIYQCQRGTTLSSDYDCRHSLNTKTDAVGSKDITTPWQESENGKQTRSSSESEEPGVTFLMKGRPIYIKEALYALIFVVICYISASIFIGIGYEYVKRYQDKRNRRELNNAVRQLSRFKSVADKLEQKGLVVLKGRCGAGKSTFGNCLQHEYKRQNYKIIPIHFQKSSKTDDYFKSKKTSYNSFIYIDNLPWWLLEGPLSEKKEGIICSKVIEMLKANTEKQTATKHKIVITLERLPKKYQTEFNFGGVDPTDCVFDFDDKNFYSLKDKDAILKTQMKLNRLMLSTDSSTEGNRTVNQSLIDCLVKENPYTGFPQMCATICEHEDHIKLGVDIAKIPPTFLVNKIDQIHKLGEKDISSAYHYCVLVAVLLGGKCESLDNIRAHIESTLLSDIYKSEHRFDPEKVEESVVFLSSFYINSVESRNIQFAHKIVRQAVMISYCKINSLKVRDRCTVEDILQFHRPKWHKPLHGENVLCGENFSSDPLFAKRISNAISKDLSNADVEALGNYTDKYKDRELLVRVENKVKDSPIGNYEARLLVFSNLGKFAREYPDEFKKKNLYVYNLVWEYVHAKVKNDEKRLRDISTEMCQPEYMTEFLKTILDKHQNTVLHYFIFWNNDPERDMLSEINNCGKETTIKTCGVLKLQNTDKHSPIHLAAHLGRYEMFLSLKQMEENENANHKMISSDIENLETSKIQSLIDTGQKLESKVLCSDDNLRISLQLELMPNRSIIFGDKDNFRSIKEVISSE